jgi:DNA-binding FrmR family transcriptional regulator
MIAHSPRRERPQIGFPFAAANRTLAEKKELGAGHRNRRARPAVALPGRHRAADRPSSRGLDARRAVWQYTPMGYMRARANGSQGNRAGARRKPAGVDPAIKAANQNRLRRIEGQVRGLQRMVFEDRYCPEILIQIASVEQALRGVARALMRNHLEHCVTKAIRGGTARESEAAYDELLDLIYRYSP